MHRGEIWVASFRPWRGREVGKVRPCPCLVLQAAWLTLQGFDTVVALPLTSQFRPGAAVLRVELPPRQRLKKPSWIMIEKVRAMDRGAFGEGPLAALSHDEMIVVGTRLCLVLGMG
jgi:mRNA interferase MazF